MAQESNNQFKDYYKILGLSRYAKETEIRNRYIELVKQYHPDKFSPTSKKERDMIYEINEAYMILGNPEKKKDYDFYLTKIDKEPLISKESKNLNELIDKGIDHCLKGEYKKSIDIFVNIIKTVKNNPYVWSFLGLATALNGNIKEGAEYAQKAIQIESTNGLFYYNLGLVYEKSGMKNLAYKNFKLAVQYDPYSPRFKKKEVEYQKYADSEKKGGGFIDSLLGLFKKKKDNL